ncbi:hypothetical protein HDK90DRAFT_318668 [Phyllosticta capitalensis]|uniref:Uncharacterized protein n=1 Tax=Phyllosticta capitalensis TaxID=121624 RepID=A0ABR1YHI7_9PEZI
MLRSLLRLRRSASTSAPTPDPHPFSARGLLQTLQACRTTAPGNSRGRSCGFSAILPLGPGPRPRPRPRPRHGSGTCVGSTAPRMVSERSASLEKPDDDTQGGTCGSMRQRREAKIQQLHRFVLSCRCGASDSRLFRVCIYYGANPYPDPRTCVCLSGLAAEARCFFCLHVPCNQLQATAGLPLAALDWCNHAELARLDTIPHLLLPCIYTDPDLQTCVCLSSLAAEALRLSRLPGSSFSTFSRHFRRLAQKLACPPSRNQSRPMTPS